MIDSILLEKINLFQIYDIKVVREIFILNITYSFKIKDIKEYKSGLIPLKNFGKIWKFSFILDKEF